jgi:hypothetical protein
MADKTEAALAATPSPTPAFKVTVGGQEYTQDVPKGLDQVIVETHLDKIGVCQLTFAHSLKPSSIKIGSDVEVSVGGDARKAFKGYVTAMNHTWNSGVEKVTVVAMDPLVKLASSNITKAWGGKPTDKIKDSTLANDAISASGLTAGTVDPGGERPYVLQRAESNLTFLKRLAARNGYLVYAEEGKVHFKKPQFSGSPIPIHQPDIIKMDYNQSDRAVPAKVMVFGWDYLTKKEVKGQLAAGGVDAIGGGSPPANNIYAGEHHIVDVFVNSDAAATEMAKAEMNRLARQMVQGSCTVPGNGKLYPGVKIKIDGSFEKFNPEGLVVGVRHVIEGGQTYQTTIWFVGNTQPA